MARRIKPYNYSYRVATRFLKDHPKAELSVVYLWTIAHLDPKHNFSKEGTRQAWNDFKKLKSHAANWGMDMRASWAKHDDFMDQISQGIWDRVTKRHKITGTKANLIIIDDIIK